MEFTLTEQEALVGFGKGIDCSQAVFGTVASALGLDRETAMKIAGSFGGGMQHGDTCGCVTGALMAIGLKYSPGSVADPEQKQHMLDKKAEFEKLFAEQYGSCTCREMLGHDIGAGEIDKIMEENLFEKVCCKAVVSACQILEDIFND